MSENITGDLSTVEEWNERLTKMFPEGVLITFVTGAEEASKYDDSPQDSASRVTVSSVEDGSPVFSFHSLNTGRHFLVGAEAVEKRPYGLFVVTAEEGRYNLMLSHQMSENQRQFIKQASEF